MKHPGKIVAWSFWFCVFLSISDAFAQVTVSGNVGFDGKIHAGSLHPITVTVRNEGEAAEGTISVATGGNIFSVPFSCAERATASFQLLFIPISSSHSLQIGAVIPKQKIHIVYEVTPTFVDQPFILLCKDDNIRIDHRPDSHLSQMTTAAIDAHYFPEQWAGLSTVDTVILGEEGVSRMNERQLAALVKWVYYGGKLFLLCGRRSDLYRNTPIWGALPATIVGHVTIGAYDAIATATGETVAYKGETMLSEVEKNGNFRTILKNGDTPLAIVGPSGHGLIAMALFDFDAEPVKSLQQRWRLLAHLVAEIGDIPVIALDESGTFFAAMKPSREQNVPLSTILIFLVAYLAAIGPLDYLILKMLNKLEWTWLTFAATSLITTAVAVYLIYDYKKGLLLFDKLTIAEISPDRKATRLSTSAHIYSQSNAYYDFMTSADAVVYTTRNTPMEDNMDPNMGNVDIRDSLSATRLTFNFGENLNILGYYVPIWTGSGVQETNVDPGCKIRIRRNEAGFDAENNYPFDIDEGIIIGKDGRIYKMEAMPAGRHLEKIALTPVRDNDNIPIDSVTDKRYRSALSNILNHIRVRHRSVKTAAICWAKRSLSPLSLANASASIGELTLFIVPVEE